MLLTRLVRAARTTRTLAGAVRAHDGPPLEVLGRARALRRRGFTTSEATTFGLLDPAVPDAEVARLVSRREGYAVQDRLNPESFRALAEDKALFWRVCQWRGLPTPRLLALFRRDAPGWTPDGGAPQGRAEWEALIRDGLPPEFVLKPAWGHLGKGVRILTREGDGFADAAGGTLDAAGVLRAMAEDPDWPEWLIQERVRNHPDLRRLSATDAVQTVRAITLLERGGRARVLWADLRVVMGDAQVDNWRDGATGNGVAPVELGSGRLGPVVAPEAGASGTRVHEVHPRSGARFEGLVLPGWDDARRLLERAAPEFAPLRALGWDIVLGPDGPLLLEIQARWGPHNQSRAMPGIMAALRAELP